MKFLLLTEGSECMLASVTEDIKHMSKPSDLVQGTLDMLLLKILALEPMNGFAVSQRLKQVSGDVLQMSDGSLYPALHKLEQEGWITAEWKTSVNGRRAKGGSDATRALALHGSSPVAVAISSETGGPGTG
jgi:Transcriptional regulator PadR-like family